jgi:hypothetical protein
MARPPRVTWNGRGGDAHYLTKMGEALGHSG